MIEKSLTSGIAGSRCLNDDTMNLFLSGFWVPYSQAGFSLRVASWPSVFKAYISILAP